MIHLECKDKIDNIIQFSNKKIHRINYLSGIFSRSFLF